MVDEIRSGGGPIPGASNARSIPTNISPLDGLSIQVDPELLFAHRLAAVGNNLLNDLIGKLLKGNVHGIPNGMLSLCPLIVQGFTGVDFISKPISELLSATFARATPQNDKNATVAFALKATEWLHEKYGVSNSPLFTERLPGHAGSFRTPGEVRFRTVEPKLSAQFDPKEASSVTEISQYLFRKWGGLAGIASPSRLIFSELALRDTLDGLAKSGFTKFFEVNAAYSTRGSRTLLTFSDSHAEPTIAFCSFVSRDLLDHKLMQMRLTFPNDFDKVRVLTGTAYKSWQVAELNVRKKVQLLPKDVPIDDIVLGYSDIIIGRLKERGASLIGSWNLSTRPDDVFAKLSVYKVIGKTGIPRHVGVFHDVALRYFGKTIQPLIEPLLERGIDRVIFAGSAGSLDRTIPPHGLVIPKVFLKENPDGHSPTEIQIDNELHQLVPMGISHSGTHLSVKSPLVETRRFIDEARVSSGVTSIDVEGSKVAESIAAFNQRTGKKIRFASAYIVTDYPLGTKDVPEVNFGLHDPRFADKASTKNKYAAVLNLLWGVPDTYTPSNHTRLISSFYAHEVQEYLKEGNDVALGAVYAQVESRLSEISKHIDNDYWVSLGLVKSYRDILRALDNAGIIPLRLEAVENEPLFIEPMPRLERGEQKAMILQSLTRSATLNSGVVGYRPPDATTDVRVSSLKNAERAVDYILDCSGKKLTERDITILHGILTEGVLDSGGSGKIRHFEYAPRRQPTISSNTVFSSFVSWLAEVEPTPLNAMEAYWKFEHFHPFKDSSGRVAELIAQHTMVRGSGHPLLFPARFDIDYILSLQRNGSFPHSKKTFVEHVAYQSVQFSRWLAEHASPGELSTSEYSSDRGEVTWQDSANKTNSISTFFRTNTPFRLDREKRTFLKEDELLPVTNGEHTLVSSCVVPYRQFDWIAGLYRN